ncbi:malto-oligosyltrehalose synthase [Demetria terragena]|uniref:malto-oligosyltrehalose synthase n=1 Tax=Demetria terragena TaxID=63959 RepID=UPI00037D0182|nr:malto-oligosyltrehalose synthase [Demetria terragena]
MNFASTYRLQLHGGFTFADAQAQVPYLADLGASHLYLSPILQAVPGSQHCYDVLDHTRINEELGGEVGFRALVAAARQHDLGVVVDVVPNHMAFVAPESGNRQVWEVLRDGRDASTATWFDIDWKAGGGRIGLPVLGEPLADVLAQGQITRGELDGEPVVRYFDHVFPLALGSESTTEISEILNRQHYRLTSWREKDDVLNYRRFFEVDGLIAVRVERPEVFEQTHALLLALHREGLIDGFRIDHPDGLADPTGYLEQLTAACEPETPIWVEKILEGQERLPRRWQTSGTTGYDALRVVQAALTDPESADVLDETWAATGGEPDFSVVVAEAKRQVVEQSLAPEVERLTRRAREALPDLDPERLHDAVVEVLLGGEVYRAYVRPEHHVGATARKRLAEAFGAAFDSRPDLIAEIDALLPLAIMAEDADQVDGGEAAATDFGIRMQQTWGPVMAKGIEDTSFYRWHRLTALNEVGSDPTVVADASPNLMHDWARANAESWPRTMTTLSTHDTKRSEDVRARILALAGDPQAWQRVSQVAREQAMEAGVDLPTAHLIWQTLAGVGPIDEERLRTYLEKALREAKQHTAWVDGDSDYERSVIDFAVQHSGSGPLRDVIDEAILNNHSEIRAFTLAAKALQLTLPGVPDNYQGTESEVLALVDPDNRRPVDYGRLRESLDAGGDTLADEKLRLTTTILQLRQNRPDVFGEGGAYTPWDTGSDHVAGFFRGRPAGRVAGALGRGASTDIAVAAIRAPGRLRRAGGWGGSSVPLPAGEWRDVLSARTLHVEGTVACETLFEHGPVVVLEQQS